MEFLIVFTALFLLARYARRKVEKWEQFNQNLYEEQYRKQFTRKEKLL